MLRKIIFGNLLLFILTAGSVFAQNTVWDSTYRPGGYKPRLEQFAKEPLKKGDIVFLGNSITYGGGDWAKLLNEPTAKNRGISGDITYGVLERLDEIISARPSKIFILIGINDISRNIPDENIIENYKKMISRIRKGSRKTKIYFQTLLPVNSAFGKFPNHYNKDEHILALNDVIRGFKARKVAVVDLYPHFLNAENHLKAEITKDGLHLLPAGYQIWADVLKKGKYLR